MALETTDNGNLTLAAVNEVLGDGWVAVQSPNGLYNGALGSSGFELMQGTIDAEGDLITTADSLPVVRANNIGNTVRFRLLNGVDIDLHELQ